MLSEMGFAQIQDPVHPAGRIKAYIQNWKVLTQDPWVLEVVQGKKIEWLTTPHQMSAPSQLTFS